MIHDVANTIGGCCAHGGHSLRLFLAVERLVIALGPLGRQVCGARPRKPPVPVDAILVADWAARRVRLYACMRGR
jgi:hypothetical protein